MNEREIAQKQMRLLVEIAPHVPDELALTGGTAINVFYRNLSRYSVDLDLVYTPQTSRAEAHEHIRDLLDGMRRDALSNVPGIKVSQVTGGTSGVIRVHVRREDIEVWVETAVISRGTLFPPEQREAVPAAQNEFGRLKMQVVSFEDMYAAKLHASLARRQLRDMYDVSRLFQNEGISDKLFRTFLVYAVAARHPPSLVLSRDWNTAPLGEQKRWQYLLHSDTSEAHLLETNDKLWREVIDRLSPVHKTFLLDAHDGRANPAMIGIPQAAEWPVFQWRMMQRIKAKEANPRAHEWYRRQLMLIDAQEMGR